MAKSNVAAIRPEAIPPNRNDVIVALLNLKGVIRLSREAVFEEMGVNETLVSAEGALTLAEAEVQRIYRLLDSNAAAKAWPDPRLPAEVPHG